MNGAFPPNSSDIFLSVPAPWAISFFPTAVEPVKLIFFTTGLLVISLPTSAALAEPHVTTFSTPGGMPASSASAMSASAENGVISDGLTTIVHPAAKAAAAFRVIMADGKFHGVIAAQTPTGCLKTSMRRSEDVDGITSPYVRLASSANHSIKLAAYEISPIASANGFPCSLIMMYARSFWLASTRSYHFRNRPERCFAGICRQAGSAFSAAAIASLQSSAPMSGTTPRRAPVAGSVTSTWRSACPSVHWPPMQACSRSKWGSASIDERASPELTAYGRVARK
mmetsp:Transcript_22268/g.48600  ORF Transcript_22268/g.48600 Transcript_22268/m.48600 type:complete len:283 (-) Transcript_22268:288-1136(-)